MAIVWVVLAACQNAQPATAVVATESQVVQVRASPRTPQALLRAVGVAVEVGDQVLNNGYKVSVDQPIPAGESMHIQFAPSVKVLVNGQELRTAAHTVGEALVGAGIDLYASDFLDPPANTRIAPALVITHKPSAVLNVTIDGATRRARSAASSVGAALAESGMPILGIDETSRPEQDPRPQDGLVRLTRVAESVVLSQELLPFESTVEESSELELGLEQILMPGAPGLAVVRTRIRSEDGTDVGKEVDSQTVIRPPASRVLVRGNKIVDHTLSIDGVAITYWRSLQMYATVYSPCNSGTSDGSCSSGTASGRPAGKGVVAVDPGLFAYLNGQRLYIPGYGFAVVGDVGGGSLIESSLGISRYEWIDLGFDDNNLQDITGWITVYFLSPAPATIPDALR